MKTPIHAGVFLRTARKKPQHDNQKHEIKTFFHLPFEFLYEEITKKNKKYCLFDNNQSKENNNFVPSMRMM